MIHTESSKFDLYQYNNISIIITNSNFGNFSSYNSKLKVPVVFRKQKLKKKIQNIYKSKIEKLIHLKQVHSDKLININTNNIESNFDNILADGIITDIKNIIIGVVTADCYPIIIFSEKYNVISSIHAGWRGVKQNIHLNTIRNICKNYYLTKNNIINDFKIFIGSGMCSKCYEVTNEFLSNFNKQYFSYINNKIYFDLKQIIIDDFTKFGIKRDNIIDINKCTFEDNYFSYRKNKTKKRFFTGVFVR